MHDGINVSIASQRRCLLYCFPMPSVTTTTPPSPETQLEQALTRVSSLQKTVTEQQHNIAELTHQLEWFKQQLFGSKSERRIVENPDQLALVLGDNTKTTTPQPDDLQTVTYQRGRGKKQRADDCVSDSGLRFGPDVPLETIELPVPSLDSQSGDRLEVIGTETFYRLAQLPGSYVVICYKQPVVKNQSTQQIARIDSPSGVFDRSLADVSFLAGMLVDKFQFHIPLYRQHQRLESAQIILSRATLTNLTRRAIALLEPIADAQLQHILLSRVLAMDETPIKAGKSKSSPGKMHKGYYWPVYGEDDEIVFVYTAGRAHRYVQEIISNDFSGTIVSDGYAAYARYAAARDGVTSAQCWSHSRRKFIEAEKDEPEKVTLALSFIRALYAVEEQIRNDNLTGADKLNQRVENSKATVDTFFTWVERELENADLLPRSPFAKALNYVYTRRSALQVFLGDPDVPLDTNHIERRIRSIAMGRRNWLFCWTELGAQQVGIIQSLISTCILHDIHPYDYLVDVLQRVQIHPNHQIQQLTPREWKKNFMDNPLRSDIHPAV